MIPSIFLQLFLCSCDLVTYQEVKLFLHTLESGQALSLALPIECSGSNTVGLVSVGFKRPLKLLFLSSWNTDISIQKSHSQSP